jgi:tyrosyl-tRNA synthetase
MNSLDSLTAGVEIEFPPDGLRKKLEEKRPLRVKLGFDPTTPDLHLGHAVVLRKLKEFQEADHEVTVIIGDTTAMIGDPSGRNKSRPPLTREQVQANSKTYLDQLGLVLDVSNIQVRMNSEWFRGTTLDDTLRLLSHCTVQQMLHRNDFSHRIAVGTPINLHELVYPVMQAYDSMKMDADVEIGGSDQLFNCKVGKELQESFGKPGQVVLCMPLLVGLDGVEKMSKSKGNYVGLTDAPNDIFGKLMSVSDALLSAYVRLASTWTFEEQNFKLQELANHNSMEVKMALARHVVSIFHDEAAAGAAARWFDVNIRKLGEREYVDAPWKTIGDLLNFDSVQEAKVPLFSLAWAALKAVGKDSSKSGARRLVQQGAVMVDDRRITDPLFTVGYGTPVALKLGKHQSVRIVD